MVAGSTRRAARSAHKSNPGVGEVILLGECEMTDHITARDAAMTKAEMRVRMQKDGERIRRQTDHLAMIRNRALNALDAGDTGGAVKWRDELTEIARLAAKGLEL